MSQDLVYKVFIELAVLEGKRKLTGEWMTNDVQELPRLLKRAHQIVQRASVMSEEEGVAVNATRARPRFGSGTRAPSQGKVEAGGGRLKDETALSSAVDPAGVPDSNPPREIPEKNHLFQRLGYCHLIPMRRMRSSQDATRKRNGRGTGPRGGGEAIASAWLTGGAAARWTVGPKSEGRRFRRA